MAFTLRMPKNLNDQLLGSGSDNLSLWVTNELRKIPSASITSNRLARSGGKSRSSIRDWTVWSWITWKKFHQITAYPRICVLIKMRTASHQGATKKSSFEISICSCTSSSVNSAGIGLNSFRLISPMSMVSLSIRRNSRWAAANLNNMNNG